MRRPTAGRSRALLSTLVVGGLVLLGGAAGAGLATAQETPSTALVRLAHLSPDTPDVDIYLQGPGGDAPTVVRQAGYGAVTSYLDLDAGRWDVSMRPAGAPDTVLPVFATSATVAAGQAYSVLVTGTGGDLTSSVVSDDLTAVTDGGARARVVQASPRATTATLQAVGGPTFVAEEPYGTVTPYSTVPAGRWSVEVTDPASTTPDVRTVDLSPGTVNTLYVVDNRSGGFDLLPVVDGTGVPAPQTPTGGVEAGFGGGLSGLDTPGLRWTAATMLLVLAAGALGLRRLVAVRP